MHVNLRKMSAHWLPALGLRGGQMGVGGVTPSHFAAMGSGCIAIWKLKF